MYQKPHELGGVPAAMGYPQFEHSLQAPIVSNQILPRFRRQLVANLFTTPIWFKDIKRAGNTIEYKLPPSVVIRDYVKDGKMKHDTPTMDKRTMKVDQAKYNSIKTDIFDEERVEGHSTYLRATLDAVAMKYAEVADKYVIQNAYSHIHPRNMGQGAGCGGCIDLGTCDEPIQITTDNFDEVMSRPRQVLNDMNIPRGNRFMLMDNSTETIATLRIMNSGNGCCAPESMRQSAFGGMIAQDWMGFDLIASNCVPQCKKGVYKILFGSKQAIAFATFLEKSRVKEPSCSWEKLYQSMMFYGSDTIFPEALGCMYVTTEKS